MAVPDWPRLPSGYRFDHRSARVDVVAAPLPALAADVDRPSRRGSVFDDGLGAQAHAVRAALALALAAHAGEERYAFAVQGGAQIVEGEVDRAAPLGNWLAQVGEQGRSSTGAGLEGARITLDEGTDDAVSEQTSPLRLRRVVDRDGAQQLELEFDTAILPRVEAQWFISHIATGAAAILSAEDPAVRLDSIALSPPEETTSFERYSSCPDTIHEPDAYPSEVRKLSAFFLHAAHLYPNDPALHFIPNPAAPRENALVLTFTQLEYCARLLAQALLAVAGASAADGRSPASTLRRGQQVVPVVIDKSPEMIISLLAIALAGYGYLALEPSFPEDRKRGICAELQEKGMLAPVAIVQHIDGELERWRQWIVPEPPAAAGGPALAQFADVLDPRAVLAEPLARLVEDKDFDLRRAFPLHAKEELSSRPDDIAYIIYTSGTTGKPKGIVVEQQNVATFLRNYRGVFGRARDERVLQFPSYSFDVSVMNIWDTFAHGATLCVTTPASLFSSLAESILALECTLVDLTPTVGALLFEHDAAQPISGETPEQAWRRAGFRIKQVNTGGEKVEKGIREKWRERGVRVCIDYGPTETTVGVISNQSTASSPPAPFSLPIGRPTGNTRIWILPPTPSDDLRPVPLGCIGEICVLGPQVTRGYVRPELNKDVFVELRGDEGLGARGEKLYRTGDLGRWVAAPWEKEGDQEGWIECLGRKDGQVKVNGLRIEIGEIEENLSSHAHAGIARSIVDKVDSETLGSALVAFLELSPAFLAASGGVQATSNGSQHYHSAGGVTVLPLTASDVFVKLVEELKRKLAEKLPAYMVPAHWLAVSRIPTQGMGKADRKTLRGLAEAWNWRAAARRRRLDAGAIDNGEPVHEEQRYTRSVHHDAARRAWAAVLRLPDDPKGRNIADSDSFMRLGGDSIRFMKLVSVLRSAGYAKISFRDIVEATTLAACAAALEKAASQTDADAAPSSQGTTAPPFSLIPAEHQDQLFDELATLSLPRSRLADVYPTAPSQEALIAPSFDSSRGHYYAQAVYDVKVSQVVLTAERLQQAIYALVERHETLRSVFALCETLGSTVSVILKPDDDEVRERCLLERREVADPGAMDEEITAWLREDRERFAFRWGRLSLSFALFSLPDGTRKLAWGMHHAMSDGWTLELLTLDLRNLCSDLPLDPRPSFAAVAEWWRNESASSTESVEFWRDYLGGAQPLGWPSQTGLEGDMLATTGAAIRHWKGELVSLAQRSGITPAIASRVAVLVALHHHGHADDVTVGIVRSGRDIDVPEAEEIIGPCVSVLPSRIRFDTASSLLALAQAEAEADRKARRHQHVTLAQLARFCDLPGRADLFDILVTFQSLAERDPDVEAAAPWPVRQPPERIHMPTNYTLSFEITPSLHDAGELELACFFDERIIKQTAVDEVLQTVATVLDYLTTAPCTPAGRLRLGGARGKQNRVAPSERLAAQTAPTNGSAALSPQQSELYERLKMEWAVVLRLEREDLGPDESFASLGGDSIGVMRLAVRLSKAGLAIPAQKLGKLPTLRRQAEWLAARE